MFLLGAGASVEAGVPATVDMARQIVQRSQDRPRSGTEARVISFVAGGLMFQQGIRGANPFAGVDVEELFAAVQLLGRRHTLEAAPFIGSWHSMIDEFDRVQTSSGFTLPRFVEGLHESVVGELSTKLPRHIQDRQAIDRALKGQGSVGAVIERSLLATLRGWLDAAKRGRPRPPAFFDRRFSEAVAASQKSPGQGEVFDRVAESMIQMLRELVVIADESRVSYLRPLLSFASQDQGLTIATLNYDNGVELLAAAESVGLTTGLDQWAATGDFARKGTDVLLLKLHGSIDWVSQPTVLSEERPLPQQGARQATTQERRDLAYRPLLVFGQGSKLTARGPFLDLLRAFRQELYRSDRLTVVGYSFRDEHINEYISQWLNDRHERLLRIIDIRFPSNDVGFAQLLRSRLEGDRLEVIQTRASQGLAQIAP